MDSQIILILLLLVICFLGYFIFKVTNSQKNIFNINSIIKYASIFIVSFILILIVKNSINDNLPIITSTTTNISFKIDNISVKRQEIDFSINTNFQLESDKILTVYVNNDIIYEDSLEASKKDFKFSIKLNKLPSEVINLIADKLSENDSVNFSVLVKSNVADTLFKSNIVYKGFKDIIANNITVSLYDKYDFNKSKLNKSDYKKMIYDVIKFNRIYLNKTSDFNSNIPVKASISNTDFVLTLSKPNNYKIWLTDESKKVINLIKLDEFNSGSNLSLKYKISKSEDKLIGIYHINIKDNISQLTYSFPIINIDGTPPHLLLSESMEINGKSYNTYYYEQNDNTEIRGEVVIDNGNWASNAFNTPITFKVYVSGDVVKIYFDGKLLRYKLNDYKYNTINLPINVGINAFEVKAIDKRGNVSTKDYIIQAESSRKNHNIIENNIYIDNE
jgi:hypothetical protein